MIALGIGVLVALVFNFLPSMIAFARSHPEKRLIGKLNILSLFSFLLWFALMGWSIGGARNDSVINRFVANTENRGRLIAIVVGLVSIGIATTAYGLARS
ncbi:MAG: Superinfection immunity protein [Pseudomonadota bacterium]